MQNNPLISIIIPVYNGEKRIKECLSSIRNQTCNQNQLEILIVDDDSTDHTVQIAQQQYGCTIVRNGTHDPERGKSIGIEHAHGEYLFFMDDDNILPHSNWLKKLIEAVDSENCIGGQAAYFFYDGKASITDQYMALFGCGDPAVYYLHRRDHMMKTEKKWELGGTVLKETSDYFKVKFDIQTLPTIGSQGFLIKKEYVEKINWKPFFYHIDSNADLIKMGYTDYIIMKDAVVHNHSKNLKDFMGKIKRNSTQLQRGDQYRSYSYNLTNARLFKLGLTLGTIVVPLWDAIKGFAKFPTPAWFLHPVISFRVALIYSWNVLTNHKAIEKIK